MADRGEADSLETDRGSGPDEVDPGASSLSSGFPIPSAGGGLERRVLGVFVLLVLLFLAEGSMTWRTVLGYLGARHRTERFEQVQKGLGDYLLDLTEAETGQRGFLLTGTIAYLRAYNAGLSRIVPEENSLLRLSEDHPRLRASLLRLVALRKMKITELQRTLLLYETTGSEAALRVVRSGRGNEIMDRIRHRIARISSREQAMILRSREQAAGRAARTGRNLLIFGVILSGIFGVSYVLIFRAERERKRLLATLRNEASHDFLTGLPNRNFLMQMLAYALSRAAREHRLLAILFIDLDGFKNVNDRFGHAMGDRVLIDVARRFTESVRSGDVLARLGGDEFVVCMTDLGSPAEAAILATRIIACLRPSILPILEETPVSCSIGIALFPESGDAPDALIRSADLAMYQAKRAGKGRYCLAGTSVQASSETHPAPPVEDYSRTRFGKE